MLFYTFLTILKIRKYTNKLIHTDVLKNCENRAKNDLYYNMTDIFKFELDHSYDKPT